jgi:hypothetical protein
VVAGAGLVVDNSYKAGRAGTERVLGSGIGNAASGQRENVGRGTVRAS